MPSTALGWTCAFALLLGPLGGAGAPVHVLQPEDFEATASRVGGPRKRGLAHRAGSVDRDGDPGHEERRARQEHVASRDMPSGPTSTTTLVDLERRRDGPRESGSKAHQNEWVIPHPEGVVTISVNVNDKLGTGSFKTAWSGTVIRPDGRREDVVVAEAVIGNSKDYRSYNRETLLHRDIVQRATRLDNILKLHAAGVFSAEHSDGNLPLDEATKERLYKQRAWKSGQYRYVLVMEKCSGGDLFDLSHRNFGRRTTTSELWVGVVMKQFLSGLSQLHGQNRAHRDIKRDNALLKRRFSGADFSNCVDGGGLAQRTTNGASRCIDADTVKLIDFGMVDEQAHVERHSCRYLRSEKKPVLGCLTTKGNDATMAPELMGKGAFKAAKFTALATDIYSTAVLWHNLLAGEQIQYRLRNQRDRYEDRLQGATPRQVRDAIAQLRASMGLRCLLTSMLDEDPSGRPKVDELLGHAYFSSGPLFEGYLWKLPMDGQKGLLRRRYFAVRRAGDSGTLTYYKTEKAGCAPGGHPTEGLKTLRIDSTVRWSTPRRMLLWHRLRLDWTHERGRYLIVQSASTRDLGALRRAVEAVGAEPLSQPGSIRDSLLSN